MRKDAYGNYSALDRLRILADVAPYSEEYRMARKEVSLLNGNGMLDESQQADYAQIREQVTSKNKRKTFYEDKFRGVDVNTEYVTIKKVIDQNNFLTEEYGDNPIRFAGVRVKKTDEESMALINDMLKPGTRVKIALDNDPSTRVRDDVYDTMRAVIYAPKNAEGVSSFSLASGVTKGTNLNFYLSKQEDVTVKDDGTDISTMALYDPVEQKIGGAFDWLIRDVVPNVPYLNVVQRVFLPVDDALSSYEREIFSKSWRSWDNPIDGWIRPMYENLSSMNPIIAALHGGGFVAGAFKGNRWKGFWIGAAIQGTMAGIRALNDSTRDGYDIWKPERRETEFEINEYFDRMTYVKYKGLYNQAVELALEEEGVDLEEIYRIQAEAKEGGREEYLLERKKWLTIEKKSRPDEELTELEEDLANIKEQLKQVGNDEVLAQIGPYTALAIRYKDTYESTLYAAGTGETYDYNKIYRSLPYKDRPYFTEFIKAKPRDRQRILELVPDNQRPIYQRYFNMEIEDVESNESYFKRYRLPDEDWEGWEAGQSLDNVKIKVMRNEGIDLTEANYWPEDEAIADEYGLPAISLEPQSLSDRINIGQLEKVLRGAGLEDVKISMLSNASEGNDNHFQTNLNIIQDRRLEVSQGLLDYLQYN